FSCYKQIFVRGQKFTYDLSELGQFYRDYVLLMEHFDATLPGRVHRVYYAQLVADPEGELRRLLDYCGLPFEGQCLRFYENRRYEGPGGALRRTARVLRARARPAATSGGGASWPRHCTHAPGNS